MRIAGENDLKEVKFYGSKSGNEFVEFVDKNGKKHMLKLRGDKAKFFIFNSKRYNVEG